MAPVIAALESHFLNESDNSEQPGLIDGHQQQQCDARPASGSVTRRRIQTMSAVAIRNGIISSAIVHSGVITSPM